MKRLRKLTALGVSVTLLSPCYAVAGQYNNKHDVIIGHGYAHRSTETPIEHLIVIVGENHTFDNIYGAYQPKYGHKVSNLLSKKIIN
ncbi:hypothetical protein [Crenothrix sp.]|uniref:hypothetical protein n=1 Tax=Crenothrix sp. TaxID=3100433 RepID=UPI00374D13B2